MSKAGRACFPNFHLVPCRRRYGAPTAPAENKSAPVVTSAAGGSRSVSTLASRVPLLDNLGQSVERQCGFRANVDASRAVGAVVFDHVDFFVFHFERFARARFDAIATTSAFFFVNLDRHLSVLLVASRTRGLDWQCWPPERFAQIGWLNLGQPVQGASQICTFFGLFVTLSVLYGPRLAQVSHNLRTADARIKR